MTTQYTPLYRFWEGQQGDPAIASSWGTPNSTNMTLVEQAINGAGSISLTGQASPYTLTTSNGATDQARNAIYNFNGTLTAPITVDIPTAARLGWATNPTVGGFTINISSGAGATAAIPNEANGPLWLYQTDGAGNTSIVSPGFNEVTCSELEVSGAIIGTGAITGASVAVTGAATSATVATTGNITAGGEVIIGGDANFNLNESAGAQTLNFQSGNRISFFTGDFQWVSTGLVNIAGGRTAAVANFGFLNNVPSGVTGYFSGSGNKTVGLSATNNITANEFDAVSDRRLKQNIISIPVGTALEWVKKSRGVTYLKDGTVSAGFIAQEQAPILPHSLSSVPRKGMPAYKDATVFCGEDHALTLAYNQYIAYLQVALKHCVERIESLEARLVPAMADAA